jgi:hypothetical protein
VKPGDLIFVNPSSKAQGRTKNRLREHGAEGFTVKGISESVGCMSNRAAILLKSVSKTSSGNEEWSGWLASEEIEVTNETR